MPFQELLTLRYFSSNQKDTNELHLFDLKVDNERRLLLFPRLVGADLLYNDLRDFGQYQSHASMSDNSLSVMEYLGSNAGVSSLI